jgi:hypothetical protein
LNYGGCYQDSVYLFYAFGECPKLVSEEQEN